MRQIPLWEALLVLAAGVAACGCGEATECDDALDKLTGECEMGAGAVIDGSLGECKDTRRCLARCINKASCSKITEVTTSEPNSYDECVNACYAQPIP